MTSSTAPRRGPSWHYVLLWLIALTSLVFNALLLLGLYNFRLRAQEEVANATAILEAVEISNFDLPVKVDERLPISLTVPFSDTFSVPISATIPVSTSVQISETIPVPIDETVRVNRDVTVSVVILGQPIPVDIPLRVDIPISLDLEIPVDLNVPIAAEIPVDLLVEVPVRTEVPIDAEVPVQLDFPVTVPLDRMGFNLLLDQVKEGLAIIADLLGADTGPG